jgi:glyoxylase-like metal-dependent hydrolase (beta-lactamase superfamily II)
MDARIISIGVLSAHPLWGERAPVRVGHATCSVIDLGSRKILIDPGLPDRLIATPLAERANLRPAEITHVFLTSFNPECRRGLRAFDHATWWIGASEREAIGPALVAKLHEATEANDPATKGALEQEVAVLHRCEAAPDSLGTHKGLRVDLFPLPGVTPGLCGLVVAGPRYTTLIAGDAVPTQEHLIQGQVLGTSADVDKARESFAEAIEIADVIVPGRDNWCLNPTKRLF